MKFIFTILLWAMPTMAVLCQNVPGISAGLFVTGNLGGLHPTLSQEKMASSYTVYPGGGVFILLPCNRDHSFLLSLGYRRYQWSYKDDQEFEDKPLLGLKEKASFLEGTVAYRWTFFRSSFIMGLLPMFIHSATLDTRSEKIDRKEIYRPFRMPILLGYERRVAHNLSVYMNFGISLFQFNKFGEGFDSEIHGFAYRNIDFGLRMELARISYFKYYKSSKNNPNISAQLNALK